jgi:3-hydroxyacyl-CoA dehydrogenase
MDYVDRLEHITVLGAAGKMGSGILLLTAMEVHRQKMKPENNNRSFILYAMDVSNQSLSGLMRYIYVQALKYAERNIVTVRKMYALRKDLIDNEEIIKQYAQDLTSLIRPGTRIEPAFDSRIVFEAVSEMPDLKVELMLTINRNSKQNPWFFSNTSAIPISWLDEEAGLNGRIMGVHFYNPPMVQNLLEVVKTPTTRPELSYFVAEFIKNIGKISVPAYDVVGFIGNGFFMRDILYAESLLEELQQKLTFPQAVYVLNKVSQDYLIRPMGVFQLVDYVGIDVVQFIMSVMNSYTENENIHSPVIDLMRSRGITGGQNHDGSQKDGFFAYTGTKITGIYDSGKKRYIDIAEVVSAGNTHLGELPEGWMAWKQIVNHMDKDILLKKYFQNLKNTNSAGGLLARKYLQQFREIGMNLVKNKVAFKYEDVNAVLTKGFHHAYGPVTDYF